MQSKKKYRDSATLKLAAEINDFVRSKTVDATVASVALQAASATLSFVEYPESSDELPLSRPLPKE
jgi:hypothetical protein